MKGVLLLSAPRPKQSGAVAEGRLELFPEWPEPASGHALASQIARVCAQAGVSPTRFGKQAINDPGLFGDLKRGRELRQKTLARVHDALVASKAGIAE